MSGKKDTLLQCSGQDLPSDPRPRPPMDGDLELRTAPPGPARSPALGSGDDGGEGTAEESESSCSGSSSAAEESWREMGG